MKEPWVSERWGRGTLHLKPSRTEAGWYQGRPGAVTATHLLLLESAVLAEEREKGTNSSRSVSVDEARLDKQEQLVSFRMERLWEFSANSQMGLGDGGAGEGALGAGG